MACQMRPYFQLLAHGLSDETVFSIVSSWLVRWDQIFANISTLHDSINKISSMHVRGDRIINNVTYCISQENVFSKGYKEPIFRH